MSVIPCMCRFVGSQKMMCDTFLISRSPPATGQGGVGSTYCDFVALEAQAGCDTEPWASRCRAGGMNSFSRCGV